jgi:peroxiredoxin
MQRNDDLYKLPADLPVPSDDAACNHLRGQRIPSVALISTQNREVRLDQQPSEWWVIVYAYPRTGRPDRETPRGWNEIPGARGCTPETSGFRDEYAAFQARGLTIYGLSTQSTEYQREMTERLELPFPVLSDERLELTRALTLPTFEFEGVTLLKRFTLVIRDSVIRHVFYPVFPPDAHALQVLQWFDTMQRNSSSVSQNDRRKRKTANE